MELKKTSLSDASEQSATLLDSSADSAQPAERSTPMTEYASRAAAALGMLLGGMVLTGWVFGVEFLKDPLPGQIVMKTNAGLCFMLCGLALLRPTAVVHCLCLDDRGRQRADPDRVRI